MSAATTKPAWGLSPLARGNRHAPSRPDAGVGPIPARTGQPPRAAPRSPLAGAYPRSHGATQGSAFADVTTQGLSPLARGNPPRPPALGGRWRPIPARTGQPTVQNNLAGLQWAYPRSHGATYAVPSSFQPRPGLSPLARGNRIGLLAVSVDSGPIPARTGQPSYTRLPGHRPRAYPRSHGATRLLLVAYRMHSGLSPLARGNRRRRRRELCAAGPIPARTGQPSYPSAGASCPRAYPRSHGATALGSMRLLLAAGLSPLARGNLGNS